MGTLSFKFASSNDAEALEIRGMPQDLLTRYVRWLLKGVGTVMIGLSGHPAFRVPHWLLESGRWLRSGLWAARGGSVGHRLDLYRS